MTFILPSPEVQIHILQANKEDVNAKDTDLETIKKWLQKQPHLPDTWDDQNIKSFLRGCSFSMEKCKTRLDMYFTARAAIPEFFADRDITRPEMQEILDLTRLGIMPNLTPNGERISIVGAVKTDFETPDIANFFKITFMLSDVRLKLEEIGVAGDIFILDASVVLFKHFVKVSLTIVRKFLVFALQAYPVKVKAVHVINATPFVDFVIKWVAPFLKEKMRKRIHVHADLESLYECVPKEALPEEYGGTAGTLKDQKEQWIKKLEEFRPWFKEQESVKADESKRPEKTINFQELFGVDGSFKQLTID